MIIKLMCNVIISMYCMVIMLFDWRGGGGGGGGGGGSIFETTCKQYV